MKIETVADLEIGDIGFYVIAGRVGGLVRVAQGLIDIVNLIRGKDAEQSWFTHAYMVIDTDTDDQGIYADIIEAMPSGARVVRLRTSDRIRPGYAYARLGLTGEQKREIHLTAPQYKGIGYSFADYLSIALLHLGLPRKLLGRYISGSERMICSQLVDFLLCRVGFHLFTDGRLSQDVTPGALFYMAGAKGEIVWW